MHPHAPEVIDAGGQQQRACHYAAVRELGCDAPVYLLNEHRVVVQASGKIKHMIYVKIQ
jgi:hypothetical protein